MKVFLLCLLLVFVVSCSDDPVQPEPEVPAVVRNLPGTWLFNSREAHSWSFPVDTYVDGSVMALIWYYGSYEIIHTSADSLVARKFPDTGTRQDVKLRMVTLDSIVGSVEMVEQSTDEVVQREVFYGVRQP